MKKKEMNIPKPGPDPFNRLVFKDQRGKNFGGCAVIVGTGRNARSHMHATAGVQEVTETTTDVIDPERLARELGVDMCAVNRGRIWTFDEGECQGGYIIDFHGVKMSWIGEMVAEDLFEQFQTAYLPSLIYRLTKWVYHAGKPAYILREPEGPTWVMQEYTKDVDPTLTIDNLHELGDKFKELPEGWTFETKILEEDLVLDTTKSDGWASIIRDEFHCTYQACGYDSDTSANYVP